MDFSKLEILSWHYPKGFVKPKLVIYFRITFITSMWYKTNWTIYTGKRPLILWASEN